MGRDHAFACVISVAHKVNNEERASPSAITGACSTPADERDDEQSPLARSAARTAECPSLG